MNIITYNVRGLGRGVKWAAIRRLIKKESVDMICIQETKKETKFNVVQHTMYVPTSTATLGEPFITCT